MPPGDFPAPRTSRRLPHSRSRVCLEGHAFAHFKAVFLAQVPVDPHRQRTAILVPEPPAYGRDVHARFDTHRGEQVAKVVVREHRQPELSTGGTQALLGILDQANAFVRLRLRAPCGPDLQQQLTEATGHRNGPRFVVLRPFLPARDRKEVPLEISVGPTKRRRFRQTTAAVGQEFDEVSASLPFSLGSERSVRIANRRDQVLELRLSRNTDLGRRDPAAGDMPGGVCEEESPRHRELEHQTSWYPVHGRMLTPRREAPIRQPDVAVLRGHVPDRNPIEVGNKILDARFSAGN